MTDATVITHLITHNTFTN